MRIVNYQNHVELFDDGAEWSHGMITENAAGNFTASHNPTETARDFDSFEAAFAWIESKGGYADR